MKHIKRESYITLFLFGIILLTVGCNLDYDGIFYQVSISEETVEVGQVYLAGIDSTTLFAYTTDVGMQSYDTVSEEWTEIDTSDHISSNILPSLVSSDGTNIYFSTRSDEGENNKIYTFPMNDTDNISVHNSDYDVITFAAPFDLMLTKDSSDNYYVRRISNPATLLTTIPSGYEAVKLMAQSDDIFLLNAYTMDDDDEKEYDYFLYDGSDLLTLTLDSDEYSIRAFYVDETNDNIAVITSDETVYYDNDFDIDSDTDFTFVESDDTVSLETTTVEDSALPVITDYSSALFYIQGDNDYIYSIDSSTGEVEDVTDDYTVSVSSITIISYLYDDSTSTAYIGTIENGVYELY
ncbi:MAG: hypothetical protein ACPKOP_08685 [Sphaerochaetaceae bacterium]